MMRSLIIAPADVHSNPVGRDVSERVVQNFDVITGQALIVFIRLVGKQRVASHTEIGRVQL